MDIEDDICIVCDGYIERGGVRVLEKRDGKWVALLPGYAAMDHEGHVLIMKPKEHPWEVN